MVYWPSSPWFGANMMKNWLFAVCGSWVRAMPQVPRMKRARLGGENSDCRSGRPMERAPPVPVPVGSPVWAMKPGITRWKGQLS